MVDLLPPSKKFKKSRKDSCTNESATNDSSNDDRVVLILKENESKVLKGMGIIQCLHGCVEIYGAKLTSTNSPYIFYSFTHHRLLTVKALTSDDRTSIGDVRKRLKKLKLKCDKLDDIKGKSKASAFSIIVISKTSSKFNFLCNIERFSYLTQPCFEVLGDDKDCILFPDEYLRVCSEWDDSLMKGEGQILLLCGGKNTGKSTFGRYLLNRTCDQQRKVAFLECDVGQTEFIPPGCVGLSVINEPILGPSYCHQMKPEIMSFVGSTNAKVNPSYYLKCIKFIMDAYRKSYSHIPLIVNTMGWSRNLGVSLLAAIIEIITPSKVVQLNGPHPRDNFPDMSPEFLSDLKEGLTDYYSFEEHSSMSGDLKHSLHILQIPFERTLSYSATITAADYRSLSLMSYFVNGNQSSLTGFEPQGGTETLAYTLSFERLALHVCHKDINTNHIVDLFHKSICSFCIVEKDLIKESDCCDGLPRFLKADPTCRSLGLGFVQSISVEERTLTVLTNICPSLVQEVNCLVVGMVDPPKMLINPNENTPSIGQPYLDYPLNTFGAAPHKAKGQCVARLRP